jgi:hypothetical protein
MRPRREIGSLSMTRTQCFGKEKGVAQGKTAYARRHDDDAW